MVKGLPEIGNPVSSVRVLFRGSQASIRVARSILRIISLIARFPPDRAVKFVFSRDDLQHPGHIRHRQPENADLIERRGVSDQSVTRHTAIAGFQTDDPTEIRRLPNRATRIAAQAHHAQSGLHRHRTASGRTSRYAVHVAGIQYVAKSRILIRRTHREFVEIVPADDDRVFCQQAVNDRRIINSGIAGQDLRGRGEGMTLERDDVLQRHNAAMQLAVRFTGLSFIIQPAGPFAGFLRIYFEKSIQMAMFCDPGKIVFDRSTAPGWLRCKPMLITCYGIKGQSHWASSLAWFFSTFTQSRMLISYSRIRGTEATIVLSISGGVMMLATITMTRIAYLRTLRR